MSHVERDLTRSVVARELWVAIEHAAYAAVSDPKNEGVPTSCLADARTERDLEPLNAAVRRPERDDFRGRGRRLHQPPFRTAAAAGTTDGQFPDPVPVQ